ncbi:MAG: hypothetical protein NTV23_08650 [Propionibacteriales bacterium]|nr:hypothetical protein [Propionibacteriales bacterium]
MSTAPTPLQRPTLKVRVVGRIKRLVAGPLYYRLRAKYEARLPDVEVRQLRELVKAYTDGPGPDVLFFGDSTMFWTRRNDPDPRNLTKMVRDELGAGTSLHSIVGPGYNVRLVAAFIEALDGLPKAPKLVVVPMSLMMASDSWIRHPVMGSVHESGAIRAMVAAGEPYPDRMPRSSEEDWNTFDRLPAASFTGAKQTLGEIRMITNSIPATAAGLPTTRWQQLVRVRHLLSLSNAGRLEPTSEGVVLAGELSSKLAERGLRSIAYIPPVNLEVVRKFWGDPAVDQVIANGDIMERTYRDASGGLGTVLNTIPLSPESDFVDPAHLSSTGRSHLAVEIVEALAARLASL